MDLFKLVIYFEWMASVTDCIAAWRDKQSERVTENDRRPVRHVEIMPVRYGKIVM